MSTPLLWRVFAANAAMLTLAFIGLVVAPVTVSAPVAASELAVLAAGLLGLLVLNLALLRPAFRPLDELAETMRRHDPLSPGRRARVPADPALAVLAQAFNEMLERLESERRDSARKALAVQGVRAPPDRTRAARRGRPDAHRRDAAGGGAGPARARRGAGSARRAARDRAPRHRGGAAHRAPPAP